jgi:mRNA-degrading endonuclease RelE of RelBE toxin-antitoxin system
MAFKIKFSEDADRHLDHLRAYDRKWVVAEIKKQLTDQADQPSRNRKELKDHPLGGWEIRSGDWRIFYDVNGEAKQAVVTAIGKKMRERLMVEGKEFEV